MQNCDWQNVSTGWVLESWGFHISDQVYQRACIIISHEIKHIITPSVPPFHWPSGEIIHWVVLDCEEWAHHTLQVLVMDTGQPRCSTTATVRICVRDLNDHVLRLPQGALRRQVGWGTVWAAHSAASRPHLPQEPRILLTVALHTARSKG